MNLFDSCLIGLWRVDGEMHVKRTEKCTRKDRVSHGELKFLSLSPNSVLRIGYFTFLYRKNYLKLDSIAHHYASAFYVYLRFYVYLLGRSCRNFPSWRFTDLPHISPLILVLEWGHIWPKFCYAFKLIMIPNLGMVEKYLRLADSWLFWPDHLADPLITLPQKWITSQIVFSVFQMILSKKKSEFILCYKFVFHTFLHYCI